MSEFAERMSQLSPDEQHEVWEARNCWEIAVSHQEATEQVIRRVMLAERRGQPLEDVDKHAMRLRYQAAVDECRHTAYPLNKCWPWAFPPPSPPYEERSDADLELAIEVIEYVQDLFPEGGDMSEFARKCRDSLKESHQDEGGTP